MPTHTSPAQNALILEMTAFANKILGLIAIIEDLDQQVIFWKAQAEQPPPLIETFYLVDESGNRIVDEEGNYIKEQ